MAKPQLKVIVDQITLPNDMPENEETLIWIKSLIPPDSKYLCTYYTYRRISIEIGEHSDDNELVFSYNYQHVDYFNKHSNIREYLGSIIGTLINSISKTPDYDYKITEFKIEYIKTFQTVDEMKSFFEKNKDQSAEIFVNYYGYSDKSCEEKKCIRQM